jgi:DNA-binding NtrC family response regulator
MGVLLLVSGILIDPKKDVRGFFYLEPACEEIVGRASRVRDVFTLIDKVRDQDVTVLVQGESGTGKELVAQAIHRRSRRAADPFVSVNCAALPEALLESELFGHEKGAFTGASARVIGRFEQADRGCLFLDEIGDMSPATQAKVLRVLEGHEFERVGGREKINVNVRIIAATNRDLRSSVSEGKFREDLFYRLGAFPIVLAPLRERKGDIPLLAANVVRRFNQQAPQPVRGFTLAAAERLFDYQWPGNIRELENVVNRAAILADGGVIDLPHIHLEEAKPSAEPPREEAVREGGAAAIRSLVEVEKEAIRAALQACAMNVSRAAKGLGISRATLYKKAKEYGIPISR